MASGGNDDFWRECASWLTRLELLRRDHKANSDTAIIADLANTLRDGVVLCNLLNKLDPGCIDSKDCNQKPAMAQFLCLKNIRTFLEKCKVNFSLRDTDLFDPLMLFDLTNFHQVLCSLSKLSRTPQALKNGDNGFSARLEKTEEDEEIYQSLRAVKPVAASYGNIRHDYHMDNYHSSEEIYEDLCAVGGLPFAETMLAQPALEKRDYVIKELKDTEKNYVEVLEKINRYYTVPLKGHVRPEDHHKIFFHLIDLLVIHTEFNNELHRTPSKDNPIRLSNIFMTFRERFLVYGKFCANLTDATNLLVELCEKNEKLNQLIVEKDKQANNGKFRLTDLLQVPMQRILKYHLLLEKLVDSTDRNHEEYKDLKRAREAMVDVASYINEMARDKDHLNVLREVDRTMVWDSNDFQIQTCGRLRKDGEIKVRQHGDTKMRTRYAFIFDKYMFLTKQTRTNQFHFRGKLDLIEFTVEDTNNRPILKDGVRPMYQWILYTTDKKTVYTMWVRSVEIKEVMVKALKDAIDNVKPKYVTTHKFSMHTFECPTTCYHCSKYLKGMIYQGYLCAKCQIAVHKECINSSGKCGQQTLKRPTCKSPELTRLKEKLWFAGAQDRPEATGILENRRTGTFLVRIRNAEGDQSNYALSLKTSNGVKHMRICSKVDGTENIYYLSTSRYFKSVEEMVRTYQKLSLRENFESLEDDSRLEYPYRQIKGEATRPFTSPDFAFKEGDLVVILSQNEYKEGWSKGMTTDGQEIRTDIRGQTINYLKVGTGNHHLFLFPGALGTIWSDFKPQIEGLDKTKFTVIAWDPPGYGRSRPQNRAFKTTFYEDDADIGHEFLSSLNVKEYSVLGWSDGGISGMIMAAKYRDSVRKLVVWGANSYVLPEELQAYNKIRDISKWSEKMKAPLVKLYGEDGLQQMWNAWCDALEQIYSKNKGDICKTMLGDIKCPTFILHGDKDPMVASEHPDYLLANITGSKIHRYPDGKHNIHLRYADEFNKLITKFLEN